MRTCPDCRSSLTKTVGEHRYRYTRRTTVKLHDITKQSCTSCGFSAVEIPKIGPLHRAIAQALGVLKVRTDALTFAFEKGPKGVEDGCWGVMILTTP